MLILKQFLTQLFISSPLHSLQIEAQSFTVRLSISIVNVKNMFHFNEKNRTRIHSKND